MLLATGFKENLSKTAVRSADLFFNEGMAWQDAAKLAQRIDVPLTYTLVAGDTANIGKVTAQQPAADKLLSDQQAVNVTVNIGPNGQS